MTVSQGDYKSNEVFCSIFTGVTNSYGKRLEKSSNETTINNNYKMNNTNSFNGVAVGYFHRCQNNFSTAIEGTIAYDSFSSTCSVNQIDGCDYNLTLNSRSNITLGMRAKLGFVCCEKWFLYCLLGTQTLNVEYKVNTVAIAGPDYYNGAKSKRLYGFVCGLGVERAISEHWRLGMEVHHVTYQKIDINPDMQSYSRLNTRLKALTALAKLSYSF